MLLQIFLENSLKFYSLIMPTYSNININNMIYGNTVMYIMNITKVFKENLQKLDQKLKFSTNTQTGFKIVSLILKIN